MPARGRCWSVLGESLVHVGDRPGDGDAAKTINNMLSATNLAAAAEALAMGIRAGLDPQRLVDCVNGGTGGSHAMRHKVGEHVLTGRFGSRFTLGQYLKDLGIARGLADAHRVPTPSTAPPTRCGPPTPPAAPPTSTTPASSSCCSPTPGLYVSPPPRAGAAAVDGAGGQPAAARIVVEEQPADELAGGEQAGQRPPGGVEHAGVLVDAHAAEREGDPAGDRERGERRLLDGQRPVGLGRVDALVPLPSLTVGSKSPGRWRR